VLFYLERERIDAMIKCAEMALEELTAGEDQLRAAFAHAAFGMVLARPDGRFAHVNPAFCALKGYTEWKLMTQDFLAITHPEDRQDSGRELQRLMDGEVPSLVIEKRYITKGGCVTWAKTSISLVPGAGGGPDHFVALFEDITERKRTGDLLEYQASHDALTGLPNRARLWQSMEAALPQGPAGRRGQDRPEVREGHAGQPEGRLHCPFRRRSGAQLRPASRGRRGGGPGELGPPGLVGL